MTATRLICAAAVLLAAPTLAQDADQPDALRGPEVSSHAKRTLVRYNMSGQFEPIEGRPEAAAAMLLDLDEPTAARVQEVIDARDMAVAMLLVEEIDLVGEVSDAIRSEQGDLAREKQLELWERFETDRPLSPLLESLDAVLSEAESDEVARLTEEYWQAVIDWQTREMRTDDPERIARVRDQTRERLAFQMFQREVQAGYQATLRRYRDAMEGIYNAVEPTEEQRAKMREILLDHIRTTQLKATPDQRRAATRRMYDLLDEERKGRFFDYLLRQIVPDNR